VTEQTYFWYDLETSGINPREDRVMQFAGQRTDLNLEPIGEPVNILIRLSEDILPAPEAILLTGITPQQTLADGVTELEFLKIFYDSVAIPDTIFVGFNSVRFDDEFMRYLNYRNFYDPYEWQWKEGRSRWDLLDVIRMTRALRPEGLQWPVVDGKPGNRLEMLTKANGIEHSNAHDALADVTASIALARAYSDTPAKAVSTWLLETTAINLR
jgi:exodeoxyribonuclease-1